MAKFTGDIGDSEEYLKPDITMFSKNDNFPETSIIEASFARMQMFIELKLSANSDPFCDGSDGGLTEHDTILGNQTRGQSLLYAAGQLAYQHRLFAFSLLIFGNKARFIRWDREGAVVSAVIDYSKRPQIVIEFFRRFNQLTAEQLGLDPTATPATPEETRMFDAAVAKIDVESLKLTTGHKNTYPRFKLEVRGPGDTTSHYIVGRALDYYLDLVSRSTRGFLALDISTQECVFLKDMWRPDVPGVEPEHVWYQKLIDAKVPNLVKFKHGFDVVQATPPKHYHGRIPLNSPETTSLEGAQRGLTHRLVSLFNVPSLSLQGRVHYRLVQLELCQPLVEFKGSKHLVSVILDSLEGWKLPNWTLNVTLM